MNGDSGFMCLSLTGPSCTLTTHSPGAWAEGSVNCQPQQNWPEEAFSSVCSREGGEGGKMWIKATFQPCVIQLSLLQGSQGWEPKLPLSGSGMMGHQSKPLPRA